jgi:hypothetical protein
VSLLCHATNDLKKKRANYVLGDYGEKFSHMHTDGVPVAGFNAPTSMAV